MTVLILMIFILMIIIIILLLKMNFIISYINNKVYNQYVENYNKFYRSLDKDNMKIESTVYYIFKKPYKFKFFNKNNKSKPGKHRKIITTKKMIKM